MTYEDVSQKQPAKYYALNGERSYSLLWALGVECVKKSSLFLKVEAPFIIAQDVSFKKATHFPLFVVWKIP